MQKSKLQSKIQNFYFLVIVFSFSFLVFNFCQAVVLYFEPSQSQYYQGDVFLVDINIDTKGECINAVEIHLSFPQDILEGVNFSKGESILTFWAKEPVINQEMGLISFIAGVPGGYCGILHGDPRKYSHLGRIAFLVKGGEVEARIKFLETSQILLNDGLGTLIQLNLKEAIFNILPKRLEVPKDEWQEKLRLDNIPPEPFEITIHRDLSIFNGEYFIVFSANDKQTGIDYFKIQEGRGSWQKAQSPYLLKDQTLKNIIRVKAVDMAGNERIIERLPTKKAFSYLDIIVFLILIGVGIIWWIIRILKRKT